jgi:hypothetical protein
MRSFRAAGKWRLSAAALLLAVATPALAGQAGGALDLSGAVPGPWPPAESGKPAIAPRYGAEPPPEARPCPPALPCGTRLLGTVRKNGAVELQAPALRW